MTNNEIDKLLGLLNKEDLDRIKKFLTNEKEKNINKLRQKTFEKYMRNEGTKFAFDNYTSTMLFEKENKLFFSNGISLYYVNKKFFDIKSTNILRNRGLYHHRIKLINEDFVQEIEDNLNKKWHFSLNNSDKYFKNIMNIESKNDIIHCFFEDDTQKEKMFQSKEYDMANILLNSPNFKLANLDIPLLKAESKIGKCYILGLKKS